MGILNVTPDSFSDGGRHEDPGAALAQAQRMLEEGADIIDVGGESTRPGAQPVDAPEQVRRVLPVIGALRDAVPGIIISIDTTRARVAQAALDVGASIINDVSAGRHDPQMFPLAASRSAPVVLMHMQGEPRTMQDNPSYGDVVKEVLEFLRQRVEAAVAQGIGRSQLLIDPGIGFGKTKEHNLQLLGGLERFVATGHGVLLGTSRKRFMGALCPGTRGISGGGGGGQGEAPRPESLVGATCATTALGVAAGVRVFRVHDVRPNRQAADVAWAISQWPTS